MGPHNLRTDFGAKIIGPVYTVQCDWYNFFVICIYKGLPTRLLLVLDPNALEFRLLGLLFRLGWANELNDEPSNPQSSRPLLI